MVTLWSDIRYGVRTLRKNPGFTTVAVLTLALGIGANTAIFSLINVLLLRPLPVRDPPRLVHVAGQEDLPLCYPHYEQFCRESQSFSGLFAADDVRRGRLVVAGSGGRVESIQAQAVTANFFEVLGVSAAAGRCLLPGDAPPPNPQAVGVISYAFWQRRFGLDPAVIGGTITLEDVPFTVVGVAPRGFWGFQVGRNPDFWWLIQMAPSVERREDVLTSYGTWLDVMGRLKPRVTRQQACAELDVMYRRILDEESVRWQLSEEQRRMRHASRIELQPGAAGWTELRGEFRRPLLALLGMVGLVLLVACANLAGLSLTRGMARHHELRTRTALGASRWALARQLLIESLLLATAGGLLGLLLAQWGGRLLARYVPGYGETVVLELTPDLRVLGFTFLVAAATGILCGILPAWRGSQVDLATALRDRTGSLMGLKQRWSQWLVVPQIGLSCCLLIGAGLFVRTVQKLKSLDLGFNRKHLMVFELDAGKDYDHTRWVSLCHEVHERVARLPGVASTSLSSNRTLTGAAGGRGPRKVAAYGAAVREEDGLEVYNVCVTSGYFQTLGIPLLRGRDFGPQDEPAPGIDLWKQSPHPVIIDETGAHRLFGEANPVGALLQPIGLRPGQGWSSLEVIGVVKDVIQQNLREGGMITLYGPEIAYPKECVFFYVRTLGDPLALSRGIRQAVRELDPRVEVTGLRTMDDLLERQLYRERLTSELAGFFGLSALLLACLGLYGILSYAVARRTQEIGVRMALGARAGDVLSLVLRQGMKLAMAGCAMGLVLAWTLTRLISSQLYGITSLDPWTFASGASVLLLVALLACYIPARRAARIDPMTALRRE